MRRPLPLLVLCCAAGLVPITGSVPAAAATLVSPADFAIAQDIHLNFHHRLGEKEARRRVVAKLEDLQRQFASKIGASTITWDGDTAHLVVSAFTQTALARVSVSGTDVDIRAHLPLLISPLAGNIKAFLTKTAASTLKP